jgi:LPXTG-motif cell wall-anchored protein
LGGTLIQATYDNVDTYTATEFTAKENGTNGYTVTFAEDYLKANNAPVAVHIDYTGKITNQAVFNVNEDNNTVDVTYTNGPNNEKGVLRDRTNHYTFSLGADVFGKEHADGWTYELVKVAVDEENNPVVSASQVSPWHTDSVRHPLKDATFGLFTDATCNTPYTNDLYPNGATFTTDSTGVITFRGLSAGTYYLKETAAPAGYIMDSRVQEITITAVYEQVTIPETVENGMPVASYTVEYLKSYSVSVGNASVYDSTTNTYVDPANNVVNTYTFDNDGPTIHEMGVSTYKDSDIKNTEGIQLPSTGGVGTTLFYAIGAILVLGAGILLVTKRRMSAY